MRAHLVTILFFILALSCTAAIGQAPRPTPTPTPDTQNVKPENLEGVPAIAPGYRSDDRTLPDLGRVGVDMTDEKSLTMADAIEMALTNNKDISVAKKTNRMAEYDLSAARGVYQPRLAGQTYYERATIPNTSIFSTNTTQTTGTILGNAGVTGYVPHFGTVLSGTFNNSQVTSDNPITILSPQFTSGATFSVTQPLLRGLRFDANRRTIEIAKRNITLTDTQFRQKSIEIVASVQKGYWDLAYALRNLQVQRDSLREAQAQLDHNRRLVTEGQLAPIDVVAAETQVANYEQAVYDALNTVNLAENVLKNLITPDRNDPLWAQAITPVDSVDVAVPDPSLTQAMDLAVQNRPELDINKTQRDINRIDQRYYRELKKPQVDLIASYTSSGIGGSLNPNFSNPFARTVCADPTSPDCQALAVQQQIFLQQIGGNGTAFSDILANKYPVFRVGLNFNIPLFGDKTASAQLAKSEVEGERIDDQRQQLELGVQVEVRNALQAVRTGEARLRSAAIARQNSAEQYESEQRKLDNGQSDIYKVLERQTALTAARSNELRARTDLNKAIAELERATGNTLKANNVDTK